jgi:hypothetical protein
MIVPVALTLVPDSDGTGRPGLGQRGKANFFANDRSFHPATIRISAGWIDTGVWLAAAGEFESKGRTGGMDVSQ